MNEAHIFQQLALKIKEVKRLDAKHEELKAQIKALEQEIEDLRSQLP